jgi:alpha-methylacyl-CoA racemase
LGVETVIRMVTWADALIEGFRPGVAERLGIGPAECLARNPRLVYGRCSGWGTNGTLSGQAGHDLSYAGLAGAGSLVGNPAEPPPPMLEFVGDHGGGGMSLTVGILSGLLESRKSNHGQVVEASILDGALALTTPYYEAMAAGGRTDDRWTFIADGSAPFYSNYEASDGRYVGVSAIEPQFYSALLELLELPAETVPPQADRAQWPTLRRIFADRFRSKTRDEWCALSEGTDACVTPILTLSEAPHHPHHVARGAFVDVGGVLEPAPTPRFSRTPADVPKPRPRRGEHTRAALLECGLDDSDIGRLLSIGAVAEASADKATGLHGASAGSAGPDSGCSVTARQDPGRFLHE